MNDRSAARPSICLVSTVPVSLTTFLAPHVRELASTYRITIVTTRGDTSWTSGGDGLADLQREAGLRIEPLTIARRISPVADLRALVQLWTLFRRERFNLVQSITPKAGLLAMIAARMARIPRRVHWYVGQVWATRRGAGRWLLKTADTVTAACSTHLLADSASQRAFLVAQGVVRDGQVTVLADGSVCGVDMARFRPDAERRARIRGRLRIGDDAVIALYLGRLNRDKGLPELARAAAIAAARCGRLHLLIVGPDEEHLRPALERTLAAVADRVTFVDFTSEPEAFMAASDIFVLPSHREGFGATVIEAAACGIPSIGTRIYGLTDAVVDGESGLLVPVCDSEALAAAMIRLTQDGRMRAAMGTAARRRVQDQFTQERLTNALRAFYDRVLCERQ